MVARRQGRLRWAKRLKSDTIRASLLPFCRVAVGAAAVPNSFTWGEAAHSASGSFQRTVAIHFCQCCVLAQSAAEWVLHAELGKKQWPLHQAVWNANEILAHGLSLSGYSSGVEQLSSRSKYLAKDCGREEVQGNFLKVLRFQARLMFWRLLNASSCLAQVSFYFNEHQL